MSPLLPLVIGIDTIASSFFGQWYQTTDLAHYLDNGSAYTVYEAETTGEWDLNNQLVFSIAGNSFRQNKYHLNGMRIDSRTMPGNMLLHTQMDCTRLALDYHDGELFFEDDSVQAQTLRLTGNIGNLGGISPGTRQLINLFHSSGEERTMDNRPVKMRNHTVGAGTVDATFAIKGHYQHVYGYYSKRKVTAFDHTGISGMYDADNFRAQLDGEIPLSRQHSAISHQLHYFAVVNGRTDYGSEFYYNANEVAKQLSGQAGLYHTHRFANQSTLVTGLSYEINALRHDSICFARNLLDQDGEAFEPWYADGRLHSVNLSVQYDQPLLPWLRLHAEGYNSVLHFKPTTTNWSNAIYMQSIADSVPTGLYTYYWQSAPFTAGILENEVTVNGEWLAVSGLRLFGHAGVSLDGVVLGNGQTVISPNILAKVGLTYQPVWWFGFGVSVSHHRMSYTWNEVQYLSSEYLNGERLAVSGERLAATGGACRTIDKTLWRKQPSYAVLDMPIRFTFGKSRAHEFALLNSIRKYYNLWFTDSTMTVTTQPLDLMSSRVGARTPYYMSNTVQYTYRGRKWYVMASWQSYLMAGLSTLGNGPLHNNIGSLSETSAYAETYRALSEGDKPYQGNSRLNQDKSFILRLQVTYNACKYFSIGLNGKFKDGQAFTTFTAVPKTEDGKTEVTLIPSDARGINMANNAFGKRKDAFFNIELRATGRWWVNEVPMSVEVLCYNMYDFGTALTEYTFDNYDHPTYPHWTVDRGIKSMKDSRTSMSLCIPRGLLVTFRVGLEKDQHHAHRP